eukprot:6085405-Amphidinium_carterae.1
MFDGEPDEGISTFVNDGEVEDELDMVIGHRSEPILSQAHRQTLLQFLTHRLVLHVHVPTSLGIGHTDAPHKAAALAHQVGLETGSLSDFERFWHEVRSWTTDMGTELALADMK